MELGHRITTIGIGATIRLAWELHRAASALAAFAERLEGVAEGQASKWRVDVDAVLMPLARPDHKG
ncbi:hypothetical protein ABIE88_001260 [Bradyrhizobium diazoefficiens]|uniref:hypothetical protein n=1 Tax=Bradyrhizobium diazoefficiens TaxID=1355477 RepID=UPI0035113C8A